MANKKKSLPSALQTIFDFDLNQYNNSKEISEAVSKGLKRRKDMSREQFAEALSYMTGRNISVSMLNHWASIGHKHRIPADVVKAFCKLAKSNKLKELMLLEKGIMD